MKRIESFDEMSQTVGGSAFWDGFCLGVSIANLASPILAISGVGLLVLKGAAVGCLIYISSNV